MATCGSLQHIFEKPLPENQTLLESLTSSWSHSIKPVEQTDEQSSFSELFGELYVKDNSISSLSDSLSMPNDQYPFSSISSSQISANQIRIENKSSLKDLSFSFPNETSYPSCNKNDNGFTSMKSGSLQLCTEGLGFESSDDVEDLQGEVVNENWKIKEEKVESTSEKHLASETSSGEFRRSRISRGAFPPPISCIGKSGVPGVCFKSYRQDGRFVLKEVRIPTREFLRSCREDGRLKLQIIQPNDDIMEDEEEDEGDEEHDDVEDDSGQEEEEDDVGNVGDSDEA